MLSIVLESSHGEHILSGTSAQTIAEVLRLAGVPLSSVWTYMVEERPGAVAGEPTRRRARFVPASTRLGELDGTVHARVNRNIDLAGLSRPAGEATRTVVEASTEWTFPGADQGAYTPISSQLTPQECVAVVQAAVDETLDQWPPDMPRRLLVGTSGGGDSNVLLAALAQSGKLAAGDVAPVLLLGPDMDRHHDNPANSATASAHRWW